jgi:hypothetical protein
VDGRRGGSPHTIADRGLAGRGSVVESEYPCPGSGTDATLEPAHEALVSDVRVLVLGIGIPPDARPQANDLNVAVATIRGREPDTSCTQASTHGRCSTRIERLERWGRDEGTRTTLDEAYAWFREDVAACFAFLEDEYGFRRTSTRDEGRDGIFIRFRSETTAVEVAYEPVDDAVEVFLIKVERGRVPSYAQAWQRNWVPLFRYLDHVGARGAEGPKSVVWGDREGLGRALEHHAEALRNHGNDVLSGDFSVFDEAKAPALSEEQIYEVDESSDPWVGDDERREARRFRVWLGAKVARRLWRGEQTEGR